MTAKDSIAQVSYYFSIFELDYQKIIAKATLGAYFIY